MKLSTKGRYGLRAMIDIAKYSKESSVSIIDVAEREKISEGYLEQLFSLLKKAELVKSKRGAGGGYYLGRSPKDISVGDILRALEGDLSPVDCAAIGDSGCELEDACVTKYVWQRINDSINETVDSISLEQLVEQGKKCEVTGCDCSK